MEGIVGSAIVIGLFVVIVLIIAVLLARIGNVPGVYMCVGAIGCLLLFFDFIWFLFLHLDQFTDTVIVGQLALFVAGVTLAVYARRRWWKTQWKTPKGTGV
jgi:hypothetical protein